MYTYLIVDDEMIERKGIRMLLSWMNIRENILEGLQWGGGTGGV